MSSLPPPKSGSLRQAAQVCVQRLQAAPVFQEHPLSERKRPLPTSPSDPSPSNLPPLSQRIRRDIQIGESEIESPEREVLRSFSFSENSPAPASPCLRDVPSPASLVFTPAQCVNCESGLEKLEEGPVQEGAFEEGAVVEEGALEEGVVVGKSDQEDVEDQQGLSSNQESSLICSNCDARMTPEHQCEAMDSEGHWEDSESEHDDLESEQILYPSLDLDSEDWAEKFTDSIRRFHGN